MRYGALSLLGLAGCQLVLGIEDPVPLGGGDDDVDHDAGVDAAATIDGGPPPDAPDVPAGMCLDGATLRPIVRPVAGDLFFNELMADPAVAPDADGEWIELHANVAVDLNDVGITNGTATLTFQSATCLRFAAGSFALVARNADPLMNGNLPAVDAVLNFALPNTTGHVELRSPDAILLHYMDWAGGSAGTSFIVDDPMVCGAPAGTPTYNGTDIGTPRAANGASCN